MHRTAALLAFLGAAIFSVAGHAYSTYARWTSSPVFLLNPANADVSAAAAETAIRTALDAWNTQSGSSFVGQYGGRVSDTATANDRRNVVIFRNASNGSALATTYSWWSGSSLVDADIIFWDGAFHFFTGTTGCSGGAYIEDIAAHELGHALGLNHSGTGGATMYPSYSTCSQALRTLAADDMAGAQALYPGGSSGSSPNTAPTVSIVSPTSGTTVGEGAMMAFSGSASDAEQGNLSGSMVWSSSRDGYLGSGASVSRALTAGTHTVTASATDSGGLTSSRQITVTVSTTTGATPTSSRSLTARGYKVKGLQKVDLTWAGFTSASVDVYRNNTRIMTTSNDGAQLDPIDRKSSGSYTYKACEVGTTSCSNQTTVVF